VFPLGPVADEGQLLAACEELFQRRLDRSRPLWPWWFLPGLREGRVGLFMKLHHAVADGIAGVAAIGAFLDLAAEAPTPTAPPWIPAPTPSTRDLVKEIAHTQWESQRRPAGRRGRVRGC